MIALSSGHFSVDDQIADVITFLSNDERFEDLMEGKFGEDFAEYNYLTWSGSWVDTAASGVEPEYMQWVLYWIEAHTPVYWYEGEPYMPEDDEIEDGDYDEY